MTIIIVALIKYSKNCDEIYFFKNGSIADSGNFESLIKHIKLLEIWQSNNTFDLN